MRVVRIAVGIAFAALPLAAGYATRDAWISVAGHAVGAGGRRFETTVYMTDVSRSANDVTLTFFPAGAPAPTQRSIQLHLGANQSAAIDVGPQLTGDAGAIGALHIVSTRALMSEAHLYSIAPGDHRTAAIGEVLSAVPSDFAIGTGDSTLVHVPAGARYKLYAVETTGYPLYFSIGSGRIDRRVMLRPREESSWDLGALLPGAQPSVLRITGINGSGKIIVLGTAVAEGGEDFSAYEMMMPAKPRHRMTWPEMTAYVVAALAIGLTALYRMKKPA